MALQFEEIQENVWLRNQNNRSDDWIDETLIHRFDDLELKFGIACSDSNSKTEFAIFRDVTGHGHSAPFLISDYEIEENTDTVKQLVGNAIKHFDQKQGVSIEDIDSYLSSQIKTIEREKDVWIKNDDKQSPFDLDETLRHTFDVGNTTVEFGIRHNLSEEKPETNIIFRRESDDTRICVTVEGNFDTARRLVDNTIKHFDKEEDMSMLDIRNHLKAQLEEIHLAKKAGYVQGVCECVAAIGDDHILGKKLLSEMSVTKDAAKKYANPETYKALEKRIFAPQPEQQLEQTHKIRH